MRLAALAVSLPFLLPSAAYAAEGMPQLDFANPLTISQIVWLGLIFIVFYFFLTRSALPQVTSVLAERAERIEGDLGTARTAKAEADRAAEAVRAGTQAARAAAQNRVSEAVNAAKAEAAAQAGADDKRLDVQLAEAEARIGAARASAMGALRQVAAETAGSVVQRLTGHAPDTQDIDREVGGILATRGLA